MDINSPPGQKGDSGFEDWLYETVKLIPADARDCFVKHFDPKWAVGHSQTEGCSGGNLGVLQRGSKKECAVSSDAVLPIAA